MAAVRGLGRSGRHSGTLRGRSRAAQAGTKYAAPLEAFAAFLRAKTKEIQDTYGCSGVKYTVEVKNGRAQIKAKPNL